jgi:hypothetical protein
VWYYASVDANPQFMNCVGSLTKYFGNWGITKTELHVASGLDVFSWNKIAEKYGEAFTNYFQLQSYGADAARAQLMMNYATNVNKIPASKMIFGVHLEGSKGPGLSIKLAKRKPAQLC